MSEHPHEARGILWASAAYSIWGLMPLYWRLLGTMSAIELTVHRILWCAVFTVAVTAMRGRIGAIGAIVRTPRQLAALTATSLLITGNWTLYIYCVETSQLVEASLGLYITPLISIALGLIFLGEKMSGFRLVALCLAAATVIVQTVELGHVPLLAIGIALTFGLYGYIRKLTPVDSLDGLTIETSILFPITLSLIAIWTLRGTGSFPFAGIWKNVILVAGGVMTCVPLVLFAAGARLVRMTTLGFLQYLSPSITLLIATTLLAEPFTRTDGITFGCVWTALALVAADGLFWGTATKQTAPGAEDIMRGSA